MAPCSSPISPLTSFSQVCTATRAFRVRRVLVWGGGGLVVALLIVAAATCSSSDTAVACPPASDSNAGRLFAQARSQSGFALLYPCDLPAGQTLASVAVTGERGRQKAELIFDGPFELAVRQSQYPPAVNPDPSGASRIIVDLFPNVRATLIEKNDGSSKALYHLFWERNGLFYEVQALGPPLQRRHILLVATSLQ